MKSVGQACRLRIRTRDHRRLWTRWAPQLPGADGRVRDTARVDYLARHVEAASEALLAGVPLTGYHVWSMLDNKFLKQPGLGLKLLLPIELADYVEQMVRHGGMSRDELVQLVRNSFVVAWLDDERRTQYLSQVDEYVERAA